MEILNLYSGIGGNRKLLGDEHSITAIEIDKDVAAVYQDLFPKDKVIVGDAHKYLLENYDKYDFIWSSPPCPSHSSIRNIAGVGKGQYPPIYPDMQLYEEIIFLRKNCKVPWVIENVQSYYTPLIKPYFVGRHYFWANFVIPKKRFDDDRIHNDIIGSKPIYGFDLSGYDVQNKRTLLRNLVNPELGLYIFRCAFIEIQQKLEEAK